MFTVSSISTVWVEIYSFDTFLLISEVGIPKFAAEYITQSVGISEFQSSWTTPKFPNQSCRLNGKPKCAAHSFAVDGDLLAYPAHLSHHQM